MAEQRAAPPWPPSPGRLPATSPPPPPSAHQGVSLLERHAVDRQQRGPSVGVLRRVSRRHVCGGAAGVGAQRRLLRAQPPASRPAHARTPLIQRMGSLGSTVRLSLAGIWALYCSRGATKQRVGSRCRCTVLGARRSPPERARDVALGCGVLHLDDHHTRPIPLVDRLHHVVVVKVPAPVWSLEGGGVRRCRARAQLAAAAAAAGAWALHVQAHPARRACRALTRRWIAGRTRGAPCTCQTAG